MGPARKKTADRNPDYMHVRSSRKRSADDFDLIIGFLGFWALVLFVTTVWMEVTGKPAIIWAMGLLAVVLALGGMWRLRKKLPPRDGRRN